MTRSRLPAVIRLALLAGSAIVLATPYFPVRADTAAAPTQEALSLARTLVEKSGVGGRAALNGLVLPLPQFLAGIGIVQPQHVQAISREAVMPMLSEHGGDLTDIQVKSYATLLSVSDMKAAIAFYDSAAGQAFVHAKYRLVQDNIEAGAAAIEALRPEIEARGQAVAHAHGWPNL